jgi:S-adenosylmethionine hydrolase
MIRDFLIYVKYVNEIEIDSINKTSTIINLTSWSAMRNILHSHYLIVTSFSYSSILLKIVEEGGSTRDCGF